MKKMIRVIKAYGLVRCRDCRGEGSVNDGQYQNTCYNCKGLGGQISYFDLNDVTTILLQYGLQRNDILELIQGLLKKQIITQNFKSKSMYKVVAKDDDYREALMNLAAVEANIEAVYGDEPIVKKEGLQINPELKEKIKNMENKLPESLRKKVNKELESVEDDDEYEDEEDEEDEARS